MKDDRPEGRPVGEDPVITDTGGEVAALATYSFAASISFWADHEHVNRDQ